jgi:hypothetical protein
MGRHDDGRTANRAVVGDNSVIGAVDVSRTGVRVNATVGRGDRGGKPETVGTGVELRLVLEAHRRSHLEESSPGIAEVAGSPSWTASSASATT